MINISCLGNYGRFGNQLFQYAFARRYAEQLNTTLHTPKWVGQDVFLNISDPLPTTVLPRTAEDEIPLPPQEGIDIVGYCQGPQHVGFYTEAYAQSIFQIKPELIKILDKKLPKAPYIACHLRRGDYVEKYAHVFAIVKEESYLRKVKEIGWAEKDIIWITESSSFTNPELPDHLQFLQDFYIMMKAEVLLRANSSFSWWAGTLSDDQIIFSPRVENKTGWQDVEFIRGNDAATVWQPPNHMELKIGR